jgi:hypothetical protein
MLFLVCHISGIAATALAPQVAWRVAIVPRCEAVAGTALPRYPVDDAARQT